MLVKTVPIKFAPRHRDTLLFLHFPCSGAAGGYRWIFRRTLSTSATTGCCHDFSAVLKREKDAQTIVTLDQELAEAQERRKREAEEARRQEEQRKQARLAELAAEKDALQAEYGILLSTLKGLFAGGKRRKEIEARLAEIETEQRGLE